MGAAYLYRFDGIDWDAETKLIASDADAGDFFGYAVDLDANVAVVGAIENCLCSVPPGPIGTGAAYVFRRTGIAWAEETKLLPTNLDVDQWFGSSVSIDGNDVIVGAQNAPGLTFATGAATLYTFEAGAWSETAILVASDGGSSDFYGTSVSLRGGLAVVGAPLHADTSGGTGAAYLYTVGAGGCTGQFQRGDCNGDGSTNIADAIFHLLVLFPAAGVPPAPVCRDACDSNDDGGLDIADAISTLVALFGAPPIPLPEPLACGVDPTADALSCLQYAGCP